IRGERPVSDRQTRPRRGDVAGHGRHDAERASGPGLEVRPVLAVDLEHAAADGPDPEEPDPDLAAGHRRRTSRAGAAAGPPGRMRGTAGTTGIPRARRGPGSGAGSRRTGDPSPAG